MDVAKDGDRVAVNCVAVIRCGMAMWRLHSVRLAPPFERGPGAALCCP
jgi:hypothetical protein